MARAIWNGVVLAESTMTEVVESNRYFPPLALNREHFEESDTHTTCPKKGVANYYDIVVDGRVNPDAAWYYPTPEPDAANIKDHVAFWNGVVIER